MTQLDLLSDTVYSEQAVRKLHQLLRNADEFPVETSQIHGLRQIARQQPARVSEFAEHQKKRAERKYEIASETTKLKLESEINFWALVANLCDSTSDWSVRKEGHAYLPKRYVTKISQQSSRA